VLEEYQGQHERTRLVLGSLGLWLGGTWEHGKRVRTASDDTRATSETRVVVRSEAPTGIEPVYAGKRRGSVDARKPSAEEVVELPAELLGLLRRVAGDSLPELIRKASERSGRDERG